MSNLDLGVIGNCAYSALIDSQGRVVWCCLPRFDGDPVFCALLDGDGTEADRRGVYQIELEELAYSEQEYLENTPILVTRLYDSRGGAIEITDFAPRFEHFGRTFRPTMLVRMVKPLSGRPRIRIRLRPLSNYGSDEPGVTQGSNHIRYAGANITMRLTSDAPPTYVLQQTPFFLEEPIHLILGADEPLTRSPANAGHDFLNQTHDYWRDWVRQLALPLEWQEPIIRAAITTTICSYEETGAIIAAMTTSVPEMPGSERNWDYRFCWLRDAFFVVRALNRLGAVTVLENYLRYLRNIVATVDGGEIQPVYGIGLERRLPEREITSLPGYRGMGPVRIGNQAHEQHQHDVYGNIILASAQAFYDRRLLRPAGLDDFQNLEAIGEQAFKYHALPDASMWELRRRKRIHTSSSVMCWAACDRLSKIARHLHLPRREAFWRDKADTVRKAIDEFAWNAKLNSYVDAFEGDGVDASLLLMLEVGYLEAADPRFHGTLAAIEQKLRRKNYLMRYAAPDDFGMPVNSFIVCTFWYVEALVALGRQEEAQEIFEDMLSRRNHLGLLSEDIDVESGELWGNFPQTYSLVGLINCAIRLSRRWETVL